MTVDENRKGRPNRRLRSSFFYSDLQSSVTLPAVAGNQSLPSVVIPVNGLPPGAKMVTVYCHLVYGCRLDTSLADNKINGDQYIQVKESLAGSYINAIKVVDDALVIDVSEATLVNGGAIYGNINTIAQIAVQNKTYDFQWTLASVDGADMILYDVQTIIEVRWY